MQYNRPDTSINLLSLIYCVLVLLRRIAFESKTRLSSLFCFQDITPKEISSDLMQKFTCSCCNATYYEESERHFSVRVPEHLGMTPLNGKRVKNPKKSSISDHIFHITLTRVMTPVLKTLRFSWKKTTDLNYT